MNGLDPSGETSEKAKHGTDCCCARDGSVSRSKESLRAERTL